MEQLNVLVMCEESQAVANEFRALGHNAYSCDLLPCSGGHPEYHIKEDALIVSDSFTFYTQDARRHFVNCWDLKKSFQPCTDLAVSGARWFEKKRLSGEQENSIRFFFEVWKVSNCSENPVGIMSGGEYIKKWLPLLYDEMKSYGFPFKPSQIIQPWMFGHGETKSTCLFLRDLPLLIPTNVVEGREQRIWKMPPSEERGKLRSKTYKGIAKAMATQFGDFLLKQKNKDQPL